MTASACLGRQGCTMPRHAGCLGEEGEQRAGEAGERERGRCPGSIEEGLPPLCSLIWQPKRERAEALARVLICSY